MSQTIQEDLFWDDEAMLAKLIQDNWKLGPEDIPNIVYEMEQYAVNARIGMIYIYQMSRQDRISSMDYETFERTSTLGVKLSTRFRPDFLRWGNELRRVLSSFRRGGLNTLDDHYLWCEITGERWDKEVTGWYTVTFDVTFHVYNAAIKSAGFNDKLNNALRE